MFDVFVATGFTIYVASSANYFGLCSLFSDINNDWDFCRYHTNFLKVLFLTVMEQSSWDNFIAVVMLIIDSVW